MNKERAITLLCQMYLPHFNDKEKEALTMGIEALEKQKPLKITKVLPPDRISESENECHNCGNTLHIAMNEFNCEYCHWCGQKLDWSEVE
jgi:Zn finger protein HypA/HybF involved in hydrogenase expression